MDSVTGCIFPSYILKEIFVYTCWKITITRLEKLSLISKQVFKIIQQIHTHYQHLCMNSISFDYFIKRIGITVIFKFCGFPDSFKYYPDARREETYQYNLFQYKEVTSIRVKTLGGNIPSPSLLVQCCPKLTNIHIERVSSRNSRFVEYTPFYTLEKYPIDYNWDGFDRLNPKYVAFDTNNPDLEILLDIESIRSIVAYNIISHQSIYRIFQMNRFASLWAHIQYKDSSTNEMFNFDLPFLSQNTSLQQLVLTLESPLHRYKCDKLNQLKGNNSLNTLGLDIFDIQKVDDLDPLLAMPNIHTLIFDEDLTNAHVVQEHIKLNRNIKSLQKFGKSYKNIDYQSTVQMFEFNQSLQTIYHIFSDKVDRYTRDGLDKYYDHC